jgi:uncharacterized membrane protein YczE
MEAAKPAGRSRILFYRILCVVIGSTVLALGLSFLRYAVFGVDPISCLNIGVANQIGISFGLWQLIFYAILFVGMIIFDRGKIGFGTLYTMVTIGFKSDLFVWLILRIPFFEIFSFQVRIFAFTLGVLILYLGAAIYIESKMGLAPYDALAIIIAEKINKPDWFRWVRIGTDALCVAGGALTQSDVGIGTLIAVVLGGPLIAFYRKWLSKIKIYQIMNE